MPGTKSCWNLVYARRLFLFASRKCEEGCCVRVSWLFSGAGDVRSIFLKLRKILGRKSVMIIATQRSKVAHEGRRRENNRLRERSRVFANSRRANTLVTQCQASPLIYASQYLSDCFSPCLPGYCAKFGRVYFWEGTEAINSPSMLDHRARAPLCFLPLDPGPPWRGSTWRGRSDYPAKKPVCLPHFGVNKRDRAKMCNRLRKLAQSYFSKQSFWKAFWRKASKTIQFQW